MNFYYTLSIVLRGEFLNMVFVFVEFKVQLFKELEIDELKGLQNGIIVR